MSVPPYTHVNDEFMQTPITCSQASSTMKLEVTDQPKDSRRLCPGTMFLQQALATAASLIAAAAVQVFPGAKQAGRLALV